MDLKRDPGVKVCSASGGCEHDLSVCYMYVMTRGSVFLPWLCSSLKFGSVSDAIASYPCHIFKEEIESFMHVEFLNAQRYPVRGTAMSLGNINQLVLLFMIDIIP